MSRPLIRFECSSNHEEALHRAATEWGIEREFWDIFGTHHVASADIEARILSSLGVDVSSAESVDAARRRRFNGIANSLVPGTSVISERDRAFELSLFTGDLPSIQVELALEDGSVVSYVPARDQMIPLRDLEVDHQRWTVYRVPLPESTPLGYHKLRLFINGNCQTEARLIVCPERAYMPKHLGNGTRTGGIAVTLWGLRSRRNWGCGDFTDLRTLIDWVVEDIRASFVALNPLHITHNRFPYNASPYLPLSIFYKNFIYIDVETVREFRRCAIAQRVLQTGAMQDKLADLRRAEYVEYEQISDLKKRFLKALYRQFRHELKQDSPRARAFHEYCEQEGILLEKLALYCALDDVLHKQDRNRWTWRDWPSEYQDPDSEASKQFAAEHRLTVEFYKYIQFVADEQLDAAQQYARHRGMAIGLYHDLALATDNCGSDLWAHRKFYVTGCRVGSPPDAFAPKGQDWAFPPPNTVAHHENGYDLFRASIQKIVRHGGALRIDHVMRLFRLFWIPDQIKAADGVYVKDNVIDLLHILALESVRSRNIIVGEDLGTVTDEMRWTLAEFGVLSYRLFYFEKRRDGSFKSAQEYPHQALVSSTTHDLPTIAGFWTARDIEARRSAGLIDENGYRAQRADRDREKQRMLELLHAEKLLPADYPKVAAELPELDGTLHNAVIGFLAQTPSALLLLNQEDLTKETEQQNLPGSTAEYPNWRRKMKLKLEDLRGSASGYAAMFRHHLERTGRAN
jgi:4-alpha-glucanotransferase